MKINLSLSSPASPFSWPVVIALYFFTLIIMRGQMTITGDSFWHITTGEWILRHGTVPDQDLFSHTMRGASWTAQEWLSEIILFLAYWLNGWAGLVMLGAFCVALSLAILTNALLKNLKPIHTIEFAAIAFLLASQHFLARPHLLAIPVLVLWVAKLVEACDAGRSPSLWLLPLMTLWANLHGGFTLGIVFCVAFAFESVWNANSRNDKVIRIKAWGRFLILTVTCSLITPNGIQGILFTYQALTSTYALAIIQEWMSPNFQQFQPMEAWLLLIIAVSLHNGLRLPFIRILLLIGLIHLALKHMRSVELLGLTVPLFVARPFAQQWYDKQRHKLNADGLDRVFEKLNRKAHAGTCAALIFVFFLAAFLVLDHREVKPLEKFTAATAIGAVQSANISGPVLNSYAYGGYLINSKIAPFVDGRSDMYGDEFLKSYIDAINLSESGALQKMLHKYNIEWTLLVPTTPAIALLDVLPGWKRLHQDRYAVVHIRESSEP